MPRLSSSRSCAVQAPSLSQTAALDADFGRARLLGRPDRRGPARPRVQSRWGEPLRPQLAGLS
eukprot:1482174-Pyramimonas_sp.AAC.1